MQCLANLNATFLDLNFFPKCRFLCSTSWKIGMIKRKKNELKAKNIDKCIYVHICIKKKVLRPGALFIRDRASILASLASWIAQVAISLLPPPPPIAEMDESGQLISLGWALFWRKRHRVIYFFHYFCAPMYFTFFFLFLRQRENSANDIWSARVPSLALFLWFVE